MSTYSPDGITFRPKFSAVDRVTVSSTGVTYVDKYFNWLSWIVICFSGGLALFVAPLVKFGRRSHTLLRTQIQEIKFSAAGPGVKLIFVTMSGEVSFRTDEQTAERARQVLAG